MANLNIRRKSGFIMRGGRSIRSTTWFQGVIAQTGLSAASTAVLSTSLNAAALALRPFTIVRTRGIWRIKSDQEAAEERQQVAFGLMVPTDEAVAVGVTAIPTPATENGSDVWFVHDVLLNSIGIGTNVGRNEGAADGVNGIIDSKAMRKVDDGHTIVSVIETFSTSLGALTDSYIRMLVKLH